ncbi:MAG: UDP-N-acetylmuramoyl-tripeptide--D-alanyl-D-alanine ligase [Burkholderiales bacterium]
MMNLQEAARGIGARVSGPDVAVSGVGSDSRAVVPGELFVALLGERFDGHDYVADVMARGAAAAMVSDAIAATREQEWQAYPLLRVDDTRLALGRLAAYWRGQFAGPVVAVTGSNGKTTVKEMIASILQKAAGSAEAVLATRGNLNNEIGVPLTLLGLRSAHRYAVVEMGMNHPGEIAYLTALAQPDVAVINNAHAAHLAGLGTVEAVARAKGEIYQGLREDGTAVINADDAHAGLWRELAGKRRVLSFGLEQAADVSASYRLHPLSSDLMICGAAGEIRLTLPVPGLHNVRNALAAAATAQALGLGNEVIAAGLAAFTGVKGRLQYKTGLHGAHLIDDSYNANPDSMRAAIAVLAAMPGKRVLVIGDMGELGAGEAELHGRIGESAQAAGIDRLLALGDLSVKAARAFGPGGQHFETIEDLLAELENLLDADTAVLVKGSRFMRMERVVKSFEV